MKRPLDRPLAAIFTACQDYYLTNAGNGMIHKRGSPYEHLRKALTKVLHGMAAIHAVNYPGYSVDKHHAGYLIKFEPPMLLRVPYHVLPAFPTGHELEALWDLSREIRSGNRSSISISGSNVLRKIFEVVGDVDFCEYFPVSDSEGFNSIATNMDGNTRLVCMKVALAGKKWQYPWGSDRPTEQYFANTINYLDKTTSTMKFDYLGDVDQIGVTEITNLIIAVDDHGHSAGLTKTFAAQEASLVPIDWLPNQMNDPIEMGRYVNWLANSIADLRKKGDMRKCLKRCASLSRVLFLSEISNDIVDLVGNSSVFLSHKINELAKIHAALEPLTDDRSKHLDSLIEAQLKEFEATLLKRGGLADAVARKKFDDDADKIAKRLLAYVRPDHPTSRRAA